MVSDSVSPGAGDEAVPEGFSEEDLRLQAENLMPTTCGKDPASGRIFSGLSSSLHASSFEGRSRKRSLSRAVSSPDRSS